MMPVTVIRGTGPIVLGQPHSGTYVPSHIFDKLNDRGRQLLDTDWHVPKLYDGLLANATVVRANFSRYVIDANRAPDRRTLYPGKTTTELVPTSTFDGAPIWAVTPTEADIAERLTTFHRVYHSTLQNELDRVKKLHGVVVLYDCHSIRSEIPYLFDHRLPDLNIGDNTGTTCSPDITEAIISVCAKTSRYSYTVNGRFKGGWTTRHYGHPETGVHAIQMEISQRCYLASETPPFDYHDARAGKLRELLEKILTAVTDTARLRLMTET